MNVVLLVKNLREEVLRPSGALVFTGDHYVSTTRPTLR